VSIYAYITSHGDESEERKKEGNEMQLGKQPAAVVGVDSFATHAQVGNNVVGDTMIAKKQENT
jgi:hypothetical protein